MNTRDTSTSLFYPVRKRMKPGHSTQEAWLSMRQGLGTKYGAMPAASFWRFTKSLSAFSMFHSNRIKKIWENVEGLRIFSRLMGKGGVDSRMLPTVFKNAK